MNFPFPRRSWRHRGGFILTGVACLLGWAAGWPAAGATVRIRLTDAGSGQVTPGMICVTGPDGKVRLPPDGRLLDEPSSTRAFYEGVEFDSDPNWIGPVRKMQGRGDNNDRSYVYELLPSIPYWKEPVIHQVSGQFRIDLPAGTYRVAVEHGPEYIPVVETLRVSPTDSLEKTIILRRWIDLPRLGWWSGDVHVHHPMLKPAHRQFLLHYARAADLHVMNVLEMGHYGGTDFRQEGFGRVHRVREGDYCLVPGQEEPRSTFGHIIGLNITGMVRDLETYDFYDLAFQGLHRQEGALVGFAHFAWNGCDLPRGFPWYVTTGELDFIELLQFSRMNGMDYYDYLNLGFKLTAAAGSDTPWGSTVGEVRTFVHTGPEFDVDRWFEGLRQGRSFVSNGPFIELEVNGQWPGSEISMEAGQTARIKARVVGHPGIGLPKALVLTGNEGILQQVDSPDDRTELALEMSRAIERSQWVTASTVCDNGAQAHTTPVYLYVNQLPTWCPERGPAVIRKQLEAIDRIDEEVDSARGARERGIEERLERARKYYHYLLKKMAE